MKNKKVAEILYEIADLLEVKAVQFKPRAFRKAAQTVESLSEDIAQVKKREELEDLPGIGESIAGIISEIVSKGRTPYLTKLKKTSPD